jgi:hypothetical protein
VDQSFKASGRPYSGRIPVGFGYPVSHYFACGIVSIVVQTSELSSAFGGGLSWYFVVAVAFVSV